MSGDKPKILVVEDEELVRSFLKDFLEMKGMEVLVASGGEEAIDLFSRHREDIDLVILDLVLPGMMGEEILDALKKLDPGVKVLVTTGYGSAPSLERVRKMGALDIVTKPFDFDRLLDSVRSALYGQA